MSIKDDFDIVEDYLLSKSSLSPSTLTGYAQTASLFLAMSDWPPTPRDVGRFVRHLNRRGLKPSTVRDYCVRLKTFTRWCLETGRIERDPFIGVRLPRKEQPLPRAPTLENVQMLFTHLESRVNATLSNSASDWKTIRDFALFSLLVDSGLRVGEACALAVFDIDLDRHCVSVRKTKTRRARVAYFGKMTRGDIKLWLDIRAGLGVESDCVFISNLTSPKQMEVQTVDVRLRNLCAALGIEPFTPHQLRHFCAGFGVRNGYNVADMQRQLGHSDVRMTMRYAAGFDDSRRETHRVFSVRDKIFYKS